MSWAAGADAAGLRAPRLRVMINGDPLATPIEAEISSNSHRAADRFSLTVAANGDPIWNVAAWSAATDLQADIQIGFSALFGPSTSLLQGDIDSVAIDPVRGVVRLQGSDYSSRLIQTRTHEAFANQTSSDIASIIAERHGLSTAVTTTTTPVGRFYGVEHDRIMLDQFSRAASEWDLLCWLADQEGFDVWVTGTVLNFSRSQIDSGPALVLRMNPSAIGPCNVNSLSLHRSLPLAGDLTVTVKSWNSRQQRMVTQTAQLSRGGVAAPPTVLVRPNLTEDAALQLAQSRLAEMARHERVIEATMPGELQLTARDKVALQGTGSAFDQLYFVDEITRRLNADEGFVQVVRARNMSGGLDSAIAANG